LKGDLGLSFKYEKPVNQVITENMWISFAIALVATILQFLLAIPLGISSATHQYSIRDYSVTVFTMIGISLPTYFFAAIVIKVFSVDLGWFPSNGLISATANYSDDFIGNLQKFGDIIHHLILPIFVSVLLSIGGLMRYTRTNMLEVLNADYIRTARAKGLSEKPVIYKHAFRNTMIPLVTMFAGILPSLFGGMMITEQVFGIDGIGRLAYQALREGDIPFVMGYNMFLAILTVIGTLLSDIMYSVVDPRVKLGK
jgi:peptide/nickel transport system permease protein